MFLVGSVIAFIQTDEVQSYLVKKTTQILSQKLHTKVQISAVDIELFNKLSLKQVYIADQKGDSMLYAEKINLGIHPLFLFQKQLVCNSLTISDFKARIVVDKQKKLNIKFFLDALKSKDTSEMKMSFQINKIKLNNSSLSFDDETADYKAIGFDSKHIAVSDFNAKIELNKLNNKFLDAEISNLSFKEKSGFELENLQLKLTANKQLARISGLKINLPNSEISFSPIIAKYRKLSNLNHFENVKLEFSLNQSIIRLSDLKAFIPKLRYTKGNIKLSTKFRGSISNMRIRNFNFAYNDDLYLNGDFEFSGLPRLSETFIYANFKQIRTDKNKLQDLMSNLIGRPIVLPEKLNRLGIIRYQGSISGFTSNLVAYGIWKSNIGKINTDLMLEILPDFNGINYSGSIKADNLKVGVFVGDSVKLGNASFNISSEGTIQPKGKMDGKVNGTISSVKFRGYEYKDINIAGNFDQKDFKGNVSFNDENAQLNFDGSISIENKLPSGQFNLQVDKFNPYKLNLSGKESDVNISFNAKADFIGKDIEKTNTNFLIDSLNIYNNKHDFFVKRIHIKSEISDTAGVLTVNSELVKGLIKGRYNFIGIVKGFKNLLHAYLPSAIAEIPVGNTKPINDFVFHFSDFHLNELAEVLSVDMELSPKTTISGFYNNIDNKIYLEANSPKFRWKQKTYTDLGLTCQNPDYAMHLSTHALLNDHMKLNVDTRIAKDSVIASLAWDDPTNFSGRLNVLNLFSRNADNNLISDIALYPTQFFLKNVAWDINQSQMHTDFKKLYVQDMSIQSEDRFIKINGVASKELSDGLDVQVNQIALSNILTLVGVRRLKLDGQITGNITIMSVFDKLMLNIDGFAKDFSFNKAVWGDVKLKSNWDNSRQKLNAQCVCYNEKDTVVHLKGEYYPKKDSLEFFAKADNLSLHFLRYFLDGALQNVDGEGTAKLHFFGGLNHFLMEGDVAVNNGRFDLNPLKTTYHFTDTVHIRKDEISFRNVKAYDAENHLAIVNGKINHDVFKNFKFNFNIKCNNMLCLNTTQKDNESIYGKAYGTGNVRISGDVNKIDFNITAKTEPQTKIIIPMVTSAVATENTFIKFKPKIDPNSNLIFKKKEDNSVPSSKTRITLKIQLDATPEGEVQMIVDPIGGDMVRASGNGNLKIDYDNYDGLKLYGNYEVEKGEYIFTLQQVIRKNFSIRRGGTIRWTGNPYVALINLDAIYTVPSVSLLDILDESQLEGIARNVVPVNCLLNLTGDLKQPNIKFDLEVPSDAETQRRIKNIVNTEEMMNREMLALLVMSRFYKPDYLQNNKSGMGSEMVSILTTTVSGQLNNWLSQLSNKVNVGVNARLGNGEDFSEGGEYEVALMYQPNNRLVISSNLGYRNDVMNTTGSNFIGDLDLEYKLTKSGKLRAKAYTHSADNNYYNTSGTAKTTQGVGFVYREDFNTFRDLLNNYFDKKTKPVDSNVVDKKNINLNIK